MVHLADLDVLWEMCKDGAHKSPKEENHEIMDDVEAQEAENHFVFEDGIEDKPHYWLGNELYGKEMLAKIKELEKIGLHNYQIIIDF